MFETIFSILRSNLQPWLKTNMQDDRYYQQLLINKEMIDCEHPVFQIEMRDVPYYPPMVLYYQRIIHNNINDWLNNQWADRNMDMTSDRACYRYTNLMDTFDELLSHTDKIIQRKNYSMRSVSGDEVSFNTDTNEKICTLICYNLQAILIVAFLTWIDYYKDLLPQELLFDSPKQLAFSLIKHDLPKNIEILNLQDFQDSQKGNNSNEDILATQSAENFMHTVRKFNFVALKKVQSLSSKQQIILAEKIVMKAPWAAAMLEYLGYHEWLKNNYKFSKEKIYEHCAAAIGCSMSAYKKYVLSLHNPDSPSYEKHNANIHKQEVIDFYNNL